MALRTGEKLIKKLNYTLVLLLWLQFLSPRCGGRQPGCWSLQFCHKLMLYAEIGFNQRGNSWFRKLKFKRHQHSGCVVYITSIQSVS